MKITGKRMIAIVVIVLCIVRSNGSSTSSSSSKIRQGAVNGNGHRVMQPLKLQEGVRADYRGEEKEEPKMIVNVTDIIHGPRRSTTMLGSSNKNNNPRPSVKELLKFTTGAMPIYAAPTLLSLIDTIAIGRSSTSPVVALAALSPAATISDVLPQLCVFLSVGTTNTIASALARDDEEEARSMAHTSLVLSGMVGCALGVMMAIPLLGGRLVHLACGSNADVLASHAYSYVRIRALGLPFALIAAAAQSTSLANKDTTSPLLAVSCAAITNIIGDFVLTIRWKQGLVGAAWATSLAQMAAALVQVYMLQRNHYTHHDMWRLPKPSDARRFLPFVPLMLVICFKQMVYSSGMLLSVSMGVVSAAAHQALYSLFRFCQTIGETCSQTSQAFLAQFYVQSHDDNNISNNHNNNNNNGYFDLQKATPTAKRILSNASIVAATAVTIVSILPTFFPYLFTSSTEVARTIRSIAPYAALGLSAHALAVCSEGALLAMREVSWLTKVYLGIGIMALTVASFISRTGSNLEAVWLFFAGYHILRVILFSRRIFWSGPSARWLIRRDRKNDDEEEGRKE